MKDTFPITTEEEHLLFFAAGNANNIVSRDAEGCEFFSRQGIGLLNAVDHFGLRSLATLRAEGFIGRDELLRLHDGSRVAAVAVQGDNQIPIELQGQRLIV
jgi:hypothetical protein